MRTLLNFLYPPRCLLCDTGANLLTGLNICSACASDLPENKHACRCCALPFETVPAETAADGIICGQCLTGEPPFSSSWSPFIYAQPLEWMIQQLKFDAKLYFAELLSELMIQRLPTSIINQTVRPDVIIPMPLHKQRTRQRGFNQSLLLAQPLAEKLSIPVDSDYCVRTRHTDHQTGKTARQRRQNIKGAFSVDSSKSYQYVVIFDDVVTTASTVSEMSKELLKNGVKRVDIWSLARAEK